MNSGWFVYHHNADWHGEATAAVAAGSASAVAAASADSLAKPS